MVCGDLTRWVYADTSFVPLYSKQPAANLRQNSPPELDFPDGHGSYHDQSEENEDQASLPIALATIANK